MCIHAVLKLGRTQKLKPKVVFIVLICTTTTLIATTPVSSIIITYPDPDELIVQDDPGE